MPAWSMGKAPRGKSATTTPMTTPGPGAYAPGGTIGQPIPKWSMGKASRSSLYGSRENPGPGSYEPRGSARGPSFGMRGRYSQTARDPVPGPGAYDPDHRARQSATVFKYSFAGRPQSSDQFRSGAPGPGSYDVRVQKLQSGGRFAKDSRKPLSSSTAIFTPGPGAYESNERNPRLHAAPKYSMATKSGGSKVEPGVGSPGPGAYFTRDVIGTEGAKHTIVGRRPDSAPSYGRGAPGPGAYTIESARRIRDSGPAYKIGTEPRGKLNREFVAVPGPGAYDPLERMASTKGTAPGWGMGTSQRNPLSQISGAPGPGSYQQKEKIGEGPKYGMRPRTAVIMKQDIPGPGAYDPKKQSTAVRPPSAVMGKGSRSNEFGSGKGIPGPGSYLYSHEIRGNPAYSFGHGRKLEHGSDVPGPGTYRLPSTVAVLPAYAVPGRSKEFDFV